ncbi:MAG: hypothetical protein ACRD0P_26875 [Stackebrandtia sp.]
MLIVYFDGALFNAAIPVLRAMSASRFDAISVSSRCVWYTHHTWIGVWWRLGLAFDAVPASLELRVG